MLCGGTTATGAHQSIASVGTSGQVLTSNGASALPTFKDVGVPVGTIVSTMQSSAPTGWLLMYGQGVSGTTYEDLAAYIIPLQSTVGVPTKLGDFTVTAATDVITLTAHGLSVDNVIHFTSTTTLPAGMSANTRYFVIGSKIRELPFKPSSLKKTKFPL